MMKTDDINDQAITKDKIRDGNVTTEKLADGAVSTDKLPDGAIKTPKIADENITTSKLAEASVVTSKIADQNVTKDKLADNAVDASQVVDGSIGNAKLSPDSVTTEKIKDGSVTNEKVADDTLGIEKFDAELRKTIQAATGLPEDLSQMIQDVDKSVKQLHEKDTDLQSQIDDKQQQITANDEDISLLQTRSTQMEETIKSIAATGGASQATAVTYNNDASGLNAVNAQAAIDEVSSIVIYDVSARNNGAVFESLQSLLSISNLNTLIPASVRHGGMTIRFIQSVPNADNRYVQYRLTSKDWSINVSNWVKDKEIGDCDLVLDGEVTNGSALNSDGTISTGEFFKGFAVISYSIKTNHIYRLSFTTNEMSTDYSCANLYKNDELVKVVKLGFYSDNLKVNLVVNTYNLDVDTLKITVNNEYVYDARVIDDGILFNNYKDIKFSTGEKLENIGISSKPSLEEDNKVIKSKGVALYSFNFDDLTQNEKIEQVGITENGQITASGGVFANSDVFVFNLSNKIYKCLYDAPAFDANYIVGGLYKNGEFKKSLGSCDNHGIQNVNFILNNIGNDYDTLKVSVEIHSTSVFTQSIGKFYDKEIKEIAYPQLSDKAIWELVGENNSMTPTQTLTGAGINDNGDIEQNTFVSGGSVSSYTLTQNKLIHIKLTKPLFYSNYSVASLYKDGVWVKNLILCDYTNNDVHFLIDTRYIDADELKLCYQKDTDVIIRSTADIYFSEKNLSVGFNDLSENAVVALSGKTKILTPNNTLTGYGIYKTGDLKTDVWVSGGTVFEYAISKNNIIKVHNIQPSFSWDYISVGLYYKGSLVKTVATCNNKIVDEYYIIDTTGIDVDTLKICAYNGASNFNDVMVAVSAGVVNNYEITNKASASILVETPPLIYELTHSSKTFNVLQRVYVEGLLKHIPSGINNLKQLNLKINDAQSDFVMRDWYASEGTYSRNLYITADGYQKYRMSIDIKATSPTKLQNNKPRILQIGDSLTDNGFPALTEFIFKCYNKDLGNISTLMVGTVIDNIEFTLGNYHYTCKGANEGKSARSLSDYLRKICIVRRSGQMASYQITGKTAWDSLGLGTKTRNGIPEREYTAFENTEEDGELMRTTCHGYYDADPSQELWYWLTHFQNLTTFVYDDITYTFGSSYSTDDDAAQIAAIKYLCVNNLIDNVFYDYQTVQDSNGQYAFNFQKYLDKFRTLENDGVTRLVVGSTAGSKVTSETINVYDVCEPTHVVVVMNTNDGNLVSNGEVVAKDLILIADLISNYNSNIKIALGTTRLYGVMNDNAYNSFGFMNTFQFDNRHLQTYLKLKELIANTTYAHIPLYTIQTPNGVAKGKAFDTLDYQERNMYVGDTLHSGDNLLYLDRAYQVVAWVASTYNS